MIVDNFLVEPGLPERVVGSDVTVVTSCGTVAEHPVKSVTAVADRDIGSQFPMWNCSVIPG